MDTKDLKECKEYRLRDRARVLRVRYLGFAIDRYLFENLSTAAEEGHFSLSKEEIWERIRAER